MKKETNINQNIIDKAVLGYIIFCAGLTFGALLDRIFNLDLPLDLGSMGIFIFVLVIVSVCFWSAIGLIEVVTKSSKSK